MRNVTTIALDVSTRNVGMSVWNRDEYVTGIERTYPGKDLYRRSLAIRNDVAHWITEYRPAIVVAECPIHDPRHGPDTLFELSVPVSAIGIWCAEHTLRFELVYPTSVKAALGNARADKAEMIRLAEMFLEYQHRIHGEHHADSIGVFAAFWQARLSTELLLERATCTA